MKKHVMALTYEPKIEPVKDGRCTQTIRKGERVAVGDEILFHGWEDKAYKSSWNNRLRVVVKSVEYIYVSEEGVCFYDSVYKQDWNLKEWGSFIVNALSINDFISPSTGEELRNVLFKLNGDKAPKKPEKYQIIKWRIKHEREILRV